jgi:hypothetical protein
MVFGPMNWVKFRKSLFIATIIGCSQFIILTIIAMILYPGGSYAHPNSQQYEFFYNYFSTLGRIYALNGEINTLSRALFATALAITGLTMIGYLVAMPFFFLKRTSTKWISIISTIIGIISAIAYIGIGLTPTDRYLDLHVFFVDLGFIGLAVAIFGYSITIYLTEDFPNYLGWNYIFFTILQTIYVFILFFGGYLFSSDTNMIVQVLSQKAIVYVEIICFIIQGIGAYYVLDRQEKEKDKKVEKSLINL